jgi:hypothetical protein
MLNIEKNTLKWAKPLVPYRLSEIDGLALHHIDNPTAGLEDIHGWHLENGWSGFGYGWYVLKDGRVIEGRGFNYQAHCLNHNHHLLSIAFQGDYDGMDIEMPDAQFNAGVELTKWLKYKVPTIQVVDGHRHWRPTACPGKHFPLAEMKDFKARKDDRQMALSLSKQEGLAAIQYLHEKGRLNSPELWKNNLIADKTPYLEYVFINFAKEVKKNEGGKINGYQ